MPSYEEYIEAIRPLWDTHLLTNMGKYHGQLESSLEEYLEVPWVSLVANGHMALELVIQAFDFPEGSEVITTPFTFVSTTHAIVRNRLVPVFCDVKESDGTIDEEKIESLITEKTVAIVPVHVYGNVCNVERIEEIAEKNNLKVIYDAAHAFGEVYKNKGIATYGDASCFSFHATKVFNTIEGGAVACSSIALYEKLYNLKNFGIRGEEVVEAVGANAKLNEFNAIMGICNLRHITNEIEKRKEKYNYYVEHMQDIEGIDVFCKDMNKNEFERNYSYFPIVVKENFHLNRDELYLKMKDKKIFSRKYFYPLTCDQECYKQLFGKSNVQNARWLSNKILVLPFYADIQYSQMDQVLNILTDY